MLPPGGLALGALGAHLLHPGVKGLPLHEPLRQGAIAQQGWNFLHAHTSFPSLSSRSPHYATTWRKCAIFAPATQSLWPRTGKQPLKAVIGLNPQNHDLSCDSLLMS